MTSTLTAAALAALDAEQARAAADADAAEAERGRQAQAEAEMAGRLRELAVRYARERLAVLVDGQVDVAGLDVAHVDDESFLTVLTDGEVALAVTDDGDVFLVREVDGRWTGGPVAGDRPVLSLADLGARLAAK